MTSIKYKSDAVLRKELHALGAEDSQIDDILVNIGGMNKTIKTPATTVSALIEGRLRNIYLIEL